MKTGAYSKHAVHYWYELVRKASGMDRKICIHDFRRSLGSRMLAKSIQQDYRKLALGHAHGAHVSERYISLNNVEIREEYCRAMGKVTRFESQELLEKLVGANRGKFFPHLSPLPDVA